MMSVTLELYPAAIKALEEAAELAAKEALQQVITDSQNTVPLGQGALQQGMYVGMMKTPESTHVYIDHDMVYSRYLYFGNKMVDAETGKGPALVRDKSGSIVGYRFRKGAVLKVKQPIEKLKVRGGRRDHWLEPYISGAKKDFVRDNFMRAYKERLSKI
jgi:hypothetical protein